MERRRNRPEKYDRELVHKTVKAMEKITEVGRACRRLAPPCLPPVSCACVLSHQTAVHFPG